MEVITYKCPNCGGDLTFDPASGKYKCEYCLSSFTQEEAEKANPKAAEARCNTAIPCAYDTSLDAYNAAKMSFIISGLL